MVCLPGMRRVSHVEVVDCCGVLRFYAVGTGHRRPVTMPITRAQAAQLARRVRFVERHPSSAGSQSAPQTLQPVG